MRTIEKLLSELSRLNIKIWVEDDQLRYNAPKGILTSSLRDELVERKAEIIAFVSKAQKGSETTFPLIKPISRGENLPISFSQQRLWFLDQLEGSNATYNIPVALRLDGPLQITVLEQSLSEIIQRHETLRTTIPTINGKPVVQLSMTGYQLSIVDLTQLSLEKQASKIQQLVSEEARLPFDLAKGHLFRAILWKLGVQEHVLGVTMHHIISDGWSMGVFLRELSTLYEAFFQGKPSPLPALEIQYADFTHWQQQWLTGERLEKHVNYWKKQLAGIPTLLELPTDKPRPAIQRFRGATLHLTVPSTLTDQLKSLSQQSETTLFMTLLAAFATLLSRYSDTSDIVIGSPIANRTHSQVEPLIGFFVNTIVLRLNLENNPHFEELLRRIQSVAREAYAHQEIPFEKLVEALKLERNLSHTPLFQVMFALQSASLEQLKLSKLTLTPIVPDNVIAKFDLTLEMEETTQGLAGTLEYNTDLFERTTIERMVGHFQTLLEGIVDNPLKPIQELPLLTIAEYQQLLDWNDTSVDYPTEMCLHQLFEAQVERTPEVVAVVFEEQHLTYAELNDRANQLAHHLQTLGIKPNVLVGICIERSIDMIIGLLGILKVGGTYLPLEPTYPTARLALMLEDAEVPVLLTQSGFIQKLPKTTAQVICLDIMGSTLSHLSTTNLKSGVEYTDLAYVIYTSGSTGMPKGVMNTHKGICNRLLWMQETYQLTATDNVLQKTPFGFDVSVWEFFWPLLVGARLVVAKPDGHKDPDYLLKLIMQQHITTLHFVPSMLQVFLQQPELENCESLKRVICSGEALPFELQSRFFERFPLPVELHNLYGPTEAAVDVTHWWCQRDNPLNQVPIGQPIANIQIYLLDSYLQQVPIGVPGELYIGGVGVARGYLNRPELTEEKFISNPFSDIAESRLYKTGDLARYFPDGNIEYLDRIDNQVKIRGFRIELGEIESALAQNSTVRESVVRTLEDSHHHKYLIAYVVSHQTPVDANQLRLFLKDKLPDYMVPATFVVLESLPLTHQGKIDYRALPAPNSVRSEFSADFVAPHTLEEELLASIWSDVLSIEQIGIYDNYFDLGGDSIRSIQIIAKAKKIGFELSLQQFFQHQTIYELACLITQKTSQSMSLPSSEAFSLISDEKRQKLPEDVVDAYPLAALQAGMFFHIEFNPESGVYHNVSTLHLSLPFDEAKLRIAIQEIISRHPVLRTSFRLTGVREQLQLIHRTVPIPLLIEDLRQLSHSEQEQLVDVRFESEKKQHFDWTSPPLFRFLVLWRSEKTFQLFMTEHHAILDGWSVTFLMSELLQHYLVLLGRNVPPLQPAPESTFRDFIVLEQLAIESNESRQYWLDTFNDFTTTNVPRLPKSYFSPYQLDRDVLIDVPISMAILTCLKQLARKARVSLKSVLLAAHMKVLSVLAQQTDVVTGIAANGRREEMDGERVLGLFLNTIPFRLQLEGGTWIELVQETFKKERESLRYRRFPLAELQKTLGFGGKSLFETSFNFMNFHAYKDIAEHGDVQILSKQFFVQTNFTLTAHFNLDPLSEELNLLLNYIPSELSKAQILAIGDYYTETLSAMANQPLARYENHSLLPLQERKKLLVEYNNTATDYPKNHCIHQLFEVQVELTPEAIALVFEDQHLSYAELNYRANQVAHHLQSLGVKPEILVGILVERSVEMVVGLLGILKAGGAYVSFDPNHPKEYIAIMLEDSQVPVLIMQQNFSSLLPSHTPTRIVYLDNHSEKWQTHSSDVNLISGVMAENLAYVSYTSGSTGKPKGVCIIHQSVIRLVKNTNYASFTADQTFLQMAPIAFDASTLEIWGPLLNGAKLVVMSPHKPSLEDLGQIIKQHKITTVWLTAGLFHLMVNERLEDLKPVRQLLAGGDVLSVPHVRRVLQELKNCQVINGYGPTENTTFTCCFPMTNESQLSHSVPIGRPIANTQVYILDAFLQPVPVGVSGELYIGGDGLARGYLNNPELTREKFIANPFSNNPKSRLYKTGDLTRYLPEGNIEFLGRIDNQLKIRGFRIELGEIETVLSQSPVVRETVVICLEKYSNDKKLTAYIVPDIDNSTQVIDESSLQQEQVKVVSQWKSLFDKSYSQLSPDQDDPTFNITGWNSSYTGSAIPADEMHEWVDSTVNAILALQPKRVLEIGCGTGLLLSRIAPVCEQYWGTDFSSVALQQVETLKQKVDNLNHVVLFHRTADDFKDIEPESFDVVILSSIIQYFPSVNYLLDVLEKVNKVVKPGGYIFVGDIRNLPLLKAYHASIQLYQAPDSLTRLELQQRVQKRMAQEEELVVDPTFFKALKSLFPINNLQIHLKQGIHDNELTRFRYNVILQVGATSKSEIVQSSIRWQDWQIHHLTLSSVRQQLVENQPEIFGIRHVPNARLDTEIQTVEWLDNAASTETVLQWRENLSKHQWTSVSPEQWSNLGSELSYDVAISWISANSEGSYDVLFKRYKTKDNANQLMMLDHIEFDKRPIHPKPWHQYANNPLQSKLSEKLVPQLRQFLQDQLPEYMMPSNFVLLDKIPLTPNGKVDRRALPDPDGTRPQLEVTYVVPQTDVEQSLASVWQQVLGLEKIGIYDNFFDLGGHSLLMVQMHSELQAIFGQSLSMVDLFQHPTIHALNQHFIQKSTQMSTTHDGQKRANSRHTRKASMKQRRELREQGRS
ncbi:amino acid adenylation domain-containing protein [Candidatus Parabeggiatoa sp. HSG14]|uniref:amino acid adenylation domain-containing protein n=1 Tax=Candidatus Parabeggiatoa sp. HSG14 TaxID=3055593 RepID=UPI0025A866A0|nr:amino acid adenylation domain-containing protein [Thiotrichales bacterium HSG14]